MRPTLSRSSVSFPFLLCSPLALWSSAVHYYSHFNEFLPYWSYLFTNSSLNKAKSPPPYGLRFCLVCRERLPMCDCLATSLFWGKTVECFRVMSNWIVSEALCQVTQKKMDDDVCRWMTGNKWSTCGVRLSVGLGDRGGVLCTCMFSLSLKFKKILTVCNSIKWPV